MCVVNGNSVMSKVTSHHITSDDYTEQKTDFGTSNQLLLLVYIFLIIRWGLLLLIWNIMHVVYSRILLGPFMNHQILIILPYIYWKFLCFRLNNWLFLWNFNLACSSHICNVWNLVRHTHGAGLFQANSLIILMLSIDEMPV